MPLRNDHQTKMDNIRQLLSFVYNYTSIVVQDKQLFAGYSFSRHLYPIRGILCLLSVAFAKRRPLFDAGSFHKQADRKLSLLVAVYANIYTCIVIL